MDILSVLKVRKPFDRPNNQKNYKRVSDYRTGTKRLMAIFSEKPYKLGLS